MAKIEKLCFGWKGGLQNFIIVTDTKYKYFFVLGQTLKKSINPFGNIIVTIFQDKKNNLNPVDVFIRLS